MANCNWSHCNCKSETNCKTGGLVKWEPLTEWGIFFSINNHKILRVVIETLSSRGNSRLKSRVVGELPGLDYSLCFLFVWQMLSHLKYSTRHSCLGRCLYYYSVFLKLWVSIWSWLRTSPTTNYISSVWQQGVLSSTSAAAFEIRFEHWLKQ